MTFVQKNPYAMLKKFILVLKERNSFQSPESSSANQKL